MYNKILLIISSLFASIFLSLASAPAEVTKTPPFTAEEINQLLGRGINMGNMFEESSQGAWGNPWNPKYVNMVDSLGFDHIRLPIRWERADRFEADGTTIKGAFLKEIKTIIDSVIAKDMMIMINMHHHEALMANPAGQKARFLSQWRQIATYFKDYPEDKLLFEVLNEPTSNMTADLWNEFFADALAVIRESNPSRTVIVGTPDWGGTSGINKLVLPEDEHLIVTVHYYNPFNFTHQGADWTTPIPPTGVTWKNRESDRNAIKTEFNIVDAFRANNNNIPIHVGEFGSYDKADMESRRLWTNFVSRYFEEKGYSWAYWEFSAGFGIYNPSSRSFRQTLVDALLNDNMYEPAPDGNYVSVYTAGTAFTDWWAQNLNLSREAGALKVTVTTQGSDWQNQLTFPKLPLIAGKEYRMSFEAYSESAVDKGINTFICKNSDPWTNYSGSYTFTPTTQQSLYQYNFTSNTSDSQSRLTFDIYNIPAGKVIWIKNFELLMLEDPTNNLDTEKEGDNSSVYAHQGRVFIENKHPLSGSCFLYDVSGSCLAQHDFEAEKLTSIPASFPPGSYIVRLIFADGNNVSRKIILKK